MHDIKFLPGEGFVTQHKLLLFDFNMKKVKETRRKFVPRRKIRKLHEGGVWIDFSLIV